MTVLFFRLSNSNMCFSSNNNNCIQITIILTIIMRFSKNGYSQTAEKNFHGDAPMFPD
jgi:hypothetical protein